ncbi:MAG TPA: XdhC family protein [Saprospiraceae bacterium]|nr:XdhC family protein [Saprospiraceae bacterium]
MKTIYQQAITCLKGGNPFVLATVIRTWGSAPRKAGSHMLITHDKILGSVSGGCVESDVFRNANAIINQEGSKLIHYGVSDEDAWQVGLSCGGEIDVLLEVYSSGNESEHKYWTAIRSAIENDSGAVVFHNLGDDNSQRRAVQPAHHWDNDQAGEIAKNAFERRMHQIAEIEGTEYFIEVVPPRQKLLIFGAAHMTAELVKLARQFDFETIVIDPRSFFMDSTKIPDQPDKFIHAWPAEVLHEIPLTPYTYAVTLSHDPKIDDQALVQLLRSQVAYIGALGSKKTHAKRIARLQAAGFTEEEIQRIHAPVGIDIRAQSAQEIALSILADLIREKNKFIL